MLEGWPGEALLIKLWDTLADKGIGSLLRPGHERRLGTAKNDVKRDEILIIAQAEKQAEDIKAGRATYIDGKLKHLPPPDSSETESDKSPNPTAMDYIGRAQDIQISETLRKEANVARAIMIAEDALAEDDTPPTDDNIDDDWLFSWQEGAASVSAEELQQLWGKILAGELKEPGTFSFRTLMFMKGLSQKEASLISKIAQFTISNWIASPFIGVMKPKGIDFRDLIHLQEIGILSGVTSSKTAMTFPSSIDDKYFSHIRAHDKVLFLHHDDPSKIADIDACYVTLVGQEVFKLGNFGIDVEYLTLVAKYFIGVGFDVEMADAIGVGNNRFSINSTIKITSDS